MINDDEKQKLAEVRKDELEKIIPIEINVIAAVALLGTLQLACRHPAFQSSKTATTKFIREFAHLLQKKIVEAAPSTAFLCEAGWIERFDSPPRTDLKDRPTCE